MMGGKWVVLVGWPNIMDKENVMFVNYISVAVRWRLKERRRFVKGGL